MLQSARCLGSLFLNLGLTSLHHTLQKLLVSFVPSERGEWLIHIMPQMFILDLLNSMPQLRLSGAIMKLILWALKELDVPNVPSFWQHLLSELTQKSVGLGKWGTRVESLQQLTPHVGLGKPTGLGTYGGVSRGHINYCWILAGGKMAQRGCTQWTDPNVGGLAVFSRSTFLH